MGLKLLVRDAYHLDLKTKTSSLVSSVSQKVTYSIGAAITDGQGKPLSAKTSVLNKGLRSRLWESTGHIGVSRVPPKDVLQDEDWDPIASGSCIFNKEIHLDDVDVTPDSFLEIALRRDFGKTIPSNEVGRTRMTVRELAEMDEVEEGKGIELMLFDMGRFDDDGDVVSTTERGMPTIVRISVVRESLPEELRSKDERASSERGPYAKRLMVVTRGTRGDVQPFLALARGLAEMKNWEIILVTELSYKGRIRTQTNVASGLIRFRPSGGDTTKRVNLKVSQHAINLKVTARQTDNLQKIFLARSEYEFFPSEAAVYYWAKTMKPDFLMFGFTMASVTMLVSEVLKIPIVGFVLQPTSIPSKQYPPILPLSEDDFKKLTEEKTDMLHKAFKKLKFYQDNSPLGHNLNGMRKRRGLLPYKSPKTSTWQELKDKNYPLVIPINEDMFGGKPEDWSENAVFTDCIFLRGGTVPPIADDAQAFLDKAKGMDGKVVILAFSSMPVSKSQIVSIGLKLINECSIKVCVFAMVGGQMDLPLERSVKKDAEKALESGRLFMAPGAPFGRLFPLVDAVVLHGGLGTTSEALQAQVPAIVTGVLLLDQRFWGSRCAEMNVGPFGTHIDDFPKKCVEYVDKALEDGSEWKENAKKVGKAMTDQAADDPSGVKRNVECVVEMCEEKATPYSYAGNEKVDASDVSMSVSQEDEIMEREALCIQVM